MTATMIPVTVTFNASETPPLVVRVPSITLEKDDDWVAWTLVAAPGATLPPNATLFVHFAQPLGPFQAIRNVSRSVVIAKGNTGAQLTYPYFLFLVLEDGTIHKTQPLSLENNSATINTSPLTTVLVTPDPEHPGKLLLDVQPPVVLLHEGDVAQWEVVGDLPDNHLMAFTFGNDPVGPFKDFFLRPSGAGSQRAGAGTFTATQVGVISYSVSVWDENGTPVGSQDPSVDGLGKPPGT